MRKQSGRVRAGGVIAIILLLIILLPIGLLYGFCYDNTKHEATTEQKEVSALVEDALFESFLPAKDEGKLKFAITQDDLNAVFNKLYNGFSSDVKQWVSGVFVEVNGDQYDFYLEAGLPISFPLFATRLIISTTFSETIVEGNELDGAFVFTIDNIKIARLGHIDGIIKNFAADVISDLGKEIQNALTKAGLGITVDLANNTMTYSKESLLQDVVSKVGSGNVFVSELMNLFFEKGLTRLNANAEKAMQFDTNLAPLNTNAEYVNISDSLDLYLGGYKNNLVTLLDAGVIQASSSDLSNVFQYLVRGYNGVSASVSNAVKNLDLSSVGISDYTQYKGADLEKDKADISVSMKNQALSNLGKFATDHVIGSISEAELNSMLHASGVIGSGTIMTKQYSTGYQAVYLAVRDVTAQLVNDKVYLSVAMSINGYDARFIITTSIDEANSDLSHYKIALSIDDFYFGQYAASESLKTVIRDYLVEAFPSGETISVSNNDLIIDFSSSIDTLVDTAIKLVGTPNVSIIGEGLADDQARLQLGITPHLA